MARTRSQSQQLVLTQVHALDDVTTVVEDAADVLRVDGTGEVRVAVMFPISADSTKNRIWVTSGCIRRNLVVGILWEIIFQLGLPGQDLVSQDVLFVEEQNHRDAPVGPDGPEQVQGLSETVGGVVLPDDHVVAAAGRYEDDGPLDPLPIQNLLEVDFVHLKPGLKNPRCQHPAAQQVLSLLLGAVDQLVFIGAFKACLDAVVLPQFLGMLEEVLPEREL
uniref:Uncharacterized protein n=1 Tax=Poecilia latipinna TaxID=48699 RepID=A0A3B3UXI4_9TELE